MRLFLKVASETVGAQYLQRAEQHKQAKAAAELIFIHLLELLQGTEISTDEVLFEVFGETGAGLPDEGGYIVIDGTAATALEVDEPGVSVLDHDVTGLEVPVQERVVVFLQEVFL